MNLSTPKILLVLIVVAAGYLLYPEDETVVSTEAKYQPNIVKPSVSQYPASQKYPPRGQRYSQTDTFRPTYSGGFEQPPEIIKHRNPGFPEYRFRPLDEKRGAAGRYQSESQQLRPEYPTYSKDLPGNEYPNYRSQYPQDAPNPLFQQFRPLDEKRQSKRWQGNYWPKSTFPEQLAANRFPVR
jgi:hypothetical protein